MKDHTAEMQALADEYRRLAAQALVARECGNRDGERNALQGLHGNLIKLMQIDTDILLEEMGVK